MKNKIIINFLILLIPSFAFAQNGFDTFLDSISVNNKVLLSAKQLAVAEETGAHTGIYLPNPSVSYDYVNNPSGNYSELLVVQSFDFPTSYFRRNDIANLSASQSKYRFQQAKLEIYTNAARTYTEFIATVRKLSIVRLRELMLLQLLKGSEAKFTEGQINVFEANRIRLEVAKAKSEKQMLEVSQKNLLLQVAELNGGITYEISDTVLPVLFLAFETDTLLSAVLNRHPQSNYFENETQIAMQNVLLQKSLGLPKFEAGYRQDMNMGLNFYGFHAGITIPLFENKNSIKTAKARQLYSEDAYEAQQVNLQNSIEQLISEFVSTKQSVSELESAFAYLNTPNLLLKAFDSGQISYSEFFYEYENYFQTSIYIEDLSAKACVLQLQLFILRSLSNS